MTVTSIRKYPETLTMTITAEPDADVGRAWQLWADPRQLERWWGPPTYPATVVDHDLAPGGRVTYFMTGPDGDRSRGWWQVLAAGPPHRLELKDGFADDSGARNDAMPTMTMVVTLTDRNGSGDGHRDKVPVAGGNGAAVVYGNGRANGRRPGPDPGDPRRGPHIAIARSRRSGMVQGVETPRVLGQRSAGRSARRTPNTRSTIWSC